MLMSVMATTPAIRAYLGGSFNPVHQGHIQMAMYVYNALKDMAGEQNRTLEVSLLPNARSPFKEAIIDPAQRLAMLTLAIQGTPLHIDELEIWQSPPVYTIDSVRTLRQRYPDDSLIFIMGMDSARSLAHWKNGLELTNYVHLWIFNRSHDADVSAKIEDNQNQNLSEQDVAHLQNKAHLRDTAPLINELPLPLQGQVTTALTDLTSSFLKTPIQGRIYIDSRSVAAISSTQVREQLAINTTLSDTPLHPYNSLHLPHSLEKWLNPTVYHYIIDHQLYSVAQFR